MNHHEKSDLSSGQYQSFNAYWRARVNREERLARLHADLAVVKKSLAKAKDHDRTARLQGRYIEIALKIERIKREG